MLPTHAKKTEVFVLSKVCHCDRCGCATEDTVSSGTLCMRQHAACFDRLSSYRTTLFRHLTFYGVLRSEGKSNEKITGGVHTTVSRSAVLND